MAIPRNSRLRRLTARLIRWSLVVFALVLAVRLGWGWEAAARLASARHSFGALVTAGQRPDLGAAVPDDRNAAVVLVQAIRAIRTDGFDQFSRGDGRMPFFSRGFGPSADISRMRPLVALNEEALGLIDRAAALPQAQWPAAPLPPHLGVFTPSTFGNNFQLRWLLRAAAEVAHEQHEDAAAITDLERFLAVARIFDAAPDISNQIIAAGMRSEAALAIERWDIGPTGEAAIAARRFLAALVAQSAYSGRISASFDQETASYEQSTLDALPDLRSWWLRPLAMDAFARRLTAQMRLIPIAHATNWQEARSVTVLPVSGERTNLDLIVSTFGEPRSDIADTMRVYFRSLADVRAGSILLAAGLYRLDNGGYPRQLDSLIPKYLPASPVDPYDASGKAMRYRLDPAGPTVWSVGENGIDEEGAVGTATISGFGFMRRYGQPDIVYGAAWRLAMAATTAP